MGPILHVLTDPGPTTALRAALTRLGCDNHVATLRESRGFDLRPWLELRRHVRDVRPAIIHAWGITALRATSFLECGGLTPLWIVFGSSIRSGVKPPHSKVVACESGCSGWFDQRLARCAGATVSSIPPAVPTPAAVEREAALRELGIPPESRIIACSGLIERGHGFMEAVWVFDILRYVYPSLWLLVLGDGSQRGRVEQFARSLGREDFRVRFAGKRSDAASLLGLAEVVWAWGESSGPRPALEGLATGRPIVARQRTDFAELLGDAAVLVANADRHEAARATRRILDDASRRAEMELAARTRAAMFAPEQIAPRWVELYDQLASGRE